MTKGDLKGLQIKVLVSALATLLLTIPAWWTGLIRLDTLFICAMLFFVAATVVLIGETR